MNLIACADCVHFHAQTRAGMRGERLTQHGICAARTQSQPDHVNALPDIPTVKDGVAPVVLVLRTGTQPYCTLAVRRARRVK